MTRAYILLLLFFALTATQTPVWGQTGSISGTVIGEEGPLPFASIQIKESDKGTTTDDLGRYEIQGLRPGKHTLIASFVGHIPRKEEISLEPGDKLKVNFRLMASENLEEIVVTGTQKPTYISDSPVKVEVITAKQLDTYLPSASSSLMESISLVNGVQEVVACGVCYTNSISVNGLPGSYTAVLMDGTPIYGSLASIYGLNGIPNMIIDRFEVIKGANSTLYGSEAVAGVINVITKDPGDQPAFSADLMTSTHREAFGNLAYAPSLGRSSGYIGVNFGTGSYYQDENNDGFGDGVNSDHVSVFTKFNVHRPSEKNFTVAAKYYYEDRRNGVEAFLKDRAYKDLRGSDLIYGESIYTHRMELFGSYALNTSANLKLDYSLSSHLQDSYYGSDFYEAEQKIAFTNFTWGFNRGKHDVLIGSTLRYDAYDDNTVATEEVENGELLNRPNKQFVPGVFAQDEYTVSKRLRALGGLRVDHHAEHGLVLSPRLNLKYSGSEWATFRFNFGTGFKVVNLFTEDHAFIQGQRELIIAGDLQPERSMNFSLNYNQVYSGLGGTGSIDIEGFYTYFTNKILPDYDTPGVIRYENAIGNAQTMGVGINLSHRFFFPLTINLGLNFLRSIEEEFDEEGNSTISDILFAPGTSGVISANYHWKAQELTLAYSAQFTGRMALPEVYDLNDSGMPVKEPRPTRSQPFSLHQVQVTKRLHDQYSLYLGVNNLFNFVQEDSPLVGTNDPNHPVGFSPYFDTSYSYAPNHGIEFFVGLKWNLKKALNQALAER